MSARPTKYILIQSSAIWDVVFDYELAPYLAEAIRVWLFLSNGGHTDGEPLNDRGMARVAGLSWASWRRNGPTIMRAVKGLIDGSEPRNRIGRQGISEAKRQAIFARDGRVCRYCGSAVGPFHIDHIKPVARGGSSRDSNLGVACAPCNFSKHAKLLSEWDY